MYNELLKLKRALQSRAIILLTKEGFSTETIEQFIHVGKHNPSGLYEVIYSTNFPTGELEEVLSLFAQACLLIKQYSLGIGAKKDTIKFVLQHLDKVEAGTQEYMPVFTADSKAFVNNAV